MKKKIMFGAIVALAITGGVLIAADHIDAPAVTGPGSASIGTDITDVYAFQSPSNSNNLVLVCNTQGLLSPAATGVAKFPSDALFEFNIDNNNDNMEDLVIQCLIQNDKMRVYGPLAPTTKGTTSTILTSAGFTDVNVSAYGAAPQIGNNPNGIKTFAGPRDDPFFFDLTQFRAIIGGTASSFRSPGVDAFAGTNVMSIVVEVPKSLLGSNTINVWAESKMK
jgi:Domain of unknown function (DUF4331)